MHLAVGVPPMLRMHGDLMPIKFRDLRDTELEGYVTEILTPQPEGAASARATTSTSPTCRPRAAASASTCSARTRASARPSAPSRPRCRRSRSSALPPIVTKLCDFHQGMMLVTGSTGTGKSTTLAAMIDHLNHDAAAQHHQPRGPDRVRAPEQAARRSIQRELGTHIPSFAEGVRAAMREDPDVILVGELRDAETIRMAMTAAETGHLVLGTLHTTERRQDDRPHHRRAARRGARADQELPVAEPAGGGHADAGEDRRQPRPASAICEIMVMTRAIAKLIRPTRRTRSRASCRRARTSACRCSTRRCSTAIAGAARSIRTTPTSMRSTSGRSQKFVTDTSVLPKLDAARARRRAPTPPPPEDATHVAADRLTT